MPFILPTDSIDRTLRSRKCSLSTISKVFKPNFATSKLNLPQSATIYACDVTQGDKDTLDRGSRRGVAAAFVLNLARGLETQVIRQASHDGCLNTCMNDSMSLPE